ncbi:MAG TPA: hypothetical protein VN380_06850 [Thermoanaerobaculia bacterium]|jgi:hypothetical protein|nr:hypothetical protein [Thermoanaerobaculia bacterium]
MSHNDLTFPDVVLRLTIPGGAELLLAFLRAYFEPFFRFEDSDPAVSPRWVVRVHIGAPPRSVPAESARIDIDRSGGFLRCEGRFVDCDRGRLVMLSPFDVTTYIDRETLAVDLWGSSAASLRIPTLRVLEELATHELERDGAVYVHASAVVAQGRAVLICGNKKAGKTSGLCKLLRAFETEKMANDNCVIRACNGEAIARGWPGFFKIDLGSVALYPELGRDFPPSERALLSDSDALWKVYDKVPLYPRQGAERFGASMDVEAPVAAVIFPRFDATRAPGLSRISIDDVRGSFPGYVQGSRHPNHPDWLNLGAPSEPEVRAHIATVLSALGNAELFELRWGPSYEDLLSRVPALRSAHRGVRACMMDSAADEAWPPLPIAEMPHLFKKSDAT